MSDSSLGSPRPELPHRPALDGLRGVAVLLVLLFHAGVSWAGGGYLGVELFFVLSGFLITGLLVTEFERRRGERRPIRLGAFWGRRARRLLPALFVMVGVVAIYEATAGASRPVPGFEWDGLSTLLYFANWHQIVAGNGYFAQSALVSPLQHTWSLAIEEQFYVVWPLVVLAVLRFGGAIRQRLLLAVCVAGAVLSAVEMAWLYHGGSGLNRVYYGTDTRAQGLLCGAALAVVLATRAKSAGAPRHGRVAAVAGVAGAVAVGIITTAVGGQPGWLFRGGFLLFDVGAVLVIWAAGSIGPDLSPVRAVLSFPPLRWLGLISYGVYLWHFPLFQWLTQSSVGVGGWELLAVRLAVTLAVSVTSYFLIEQPIRQRRLPRLATLVAVPAAGLVAAVTVGVAAATAAPVAGSAGVSGLGPVGSVPLVVGTTPGLGTTPGRGTTTGSGGGGTTAPRVSSCQVRVPPKEKLVTFRTCPPLRAEVIGDSVGLTLGVEITLNEQRFGVLVDNQALLGCSYSVKGESDELGTTYGRPNSQCDTEIARWRSAEVRDGDQAVIVEMGYWDEMDWRWGTTDEQLGDRAFDDEELLRMRTLVHDLSAGGRQVILISVPLMDPGPFPNGEPSPQGSPQRNAEINSLIRTVGEHSGPDVHFLDIAPVVTPHGVFATDVDGTVCRMSDGVHFWMGPPGKFEQTRCGAAMQSAILGEVRSLLLHRS